MSLRMTSVGSDVWVFKGAVHVIEGSLSDAALERVRRSYDIA